MINCVDDHSRSEHLLDSGHLVVPAVGLLAVQVFWGIQSVLLSSLLSSGVDVLFIIYSGGLTTFIICSNFAVWLERQKWPERIRAKLVLQLVVISVAGDAAGGFLTILGMQKTSPVVACAMSNLAPGLVFVLACCLNLEKFNARCSYSVAKAVGTLLCLGGVIAMSLLQYDEDGANSSSYPSHSVGVSDVTGARHEWIAGCVYLLCGIFLMSCKVLLKAPVLEDLPAPLSLMAITTLICALFTAAIQLLYKGKLDGGNYSIEPAIVASYVVLAGISGSMCFSFELWCIKKQGPVFVSMFGPIGTVTSTIISAMALRKFLTIGSLAGVCVMIIGLYTVLWARRKERLLMLVESTADMERESLIRGADDGGVKKRLLN